MKTKEAIVLDALKTAVHKTEGMGLAYLYGSRAHGDANPDSDWDVLVVLDKDKVTPDDFDSTAFPLYDVGIEQDAAVSVNVYALPDWRKHSSTPFFKNVEREGIRL